MNFVNYKYEGVETSLTKVIIEIVLFFYKIIFMKNLYDFFRK